MEDLTIVGVILAVVSSFGVIFNWTVVIANRKSGGSLKHSFAILTANQAFGDAIHSTLFLIYVCPMILLDQKILLEYSHFVGFGLLVCYDLSTQSHFLISCNRFCAVFFPMQYSTIFSVSNTYKMTYLVNSLSIAVTLMDFCIGCPLSWLPDLWLFVFPPTTFCNIVVFYADFCKFLMVVTAVIVLDVATVFRVQQVKKKIQSSTVQDPKAAAKRAREMSFLKQTCTQGAVFTTELITYFILSPHIEHPWIRFFCSSFAWAAVHAVDGFVTILFNQDFRKFLTKNLNFIGKLEIFGENVSTVSHTNMSAKSNTNA